MQRWRSEAFGSVSVCSKDVVIHGGSIQVTMGEDMS